MVHGVVFWSHGNYFDLNVSFFGEYKRMLLAVYSIEIYESFQFK